LPTPFSFLLPFLAELLAPAPKPAADTLTSLLLGREATMARQAGKVACLLGARVVRIVLPQHGTPRCAAQSGDEAIILLRAAQPRDLTCSPTTHSTVQRG
jgi:hypothetical protein